MFSLEVSLWFWGYLCASPSTDKKGENCTARSPCPDSDTCRDILGWGGSACDPWVWGRLGVTGDLGS